MLRKSLMVIASTLLTTFGTIVYAQGGFQGSAVSQGGFQGGSVTTAIKTVEQAKAASDDTMVLLQGHIIEHIKKDDYIFKDNSGTIRVDIDHDKWAGQTVTPDNLVEIWGEVDKDWNSVEIDVKSIRVIK